MGEAAVVRVAANLFLRPRALGMVVEYWVGNMTPPLLLRTAAATAPAMSVGQCMAGFARTLMRGPVDIVLPGRGRFLLTSDATQPRWLHWLALLDDTTYSIRVPFFIEQEQGQLLTALHDMYQHVSDVWLLSDQLTRSGTLAGEHYFSHCQHMDVLDALYPRTLVVVSAYRRFMRALVHGLPPELLQSVGADLVRDAVVPLMQCDRGTDPLLGDIGRWMHAEAGTDVGALEDALAQIEDKLRPLALGLYKRLRDTYGAHAYPPEDLRAGLQEEDAPPLGAYRTCSWRAALAASMGAT